MLQNVVEFELWISIPRNSLEEPEIVVVPVPDEFPKPIILLEIVKKNGETNDIKFLNHIH